MFGAGGKASTLAFSVAIESERARDRESEIERARDREIERARERESERARERESERERERERERASAYGPTIGCVRLLAT